MQLLSQSLPSWADGEEDCGEKVKPMGWHKNSLSIEIVKHNEKEDNKSLKRNKTQERQVMHDTIAHQSLTDAHPNPSCL